MKVKTYAQAVERVKSLYPNFPLNDSGLENADSFIVEPHDDAIEGTPCYRVYKKDAKVERKNSANLQEIVQDFLSGNSERVFIVR
jgi:hypothetical protein|nr:MAG TPA: hypothetical protein [Caudoviricetes sp.]